MNAEELAAIHVAWIETLAADHAEGSERIGYAYAYGSMSAQYKATLKSLEAAARHGASAKDVFDALAEHARNRIRNLRPARTLRRLDRAAHDRR